MSVLALRRVVASALTTVLTMLGLGTTGAIVLPTPAFASTYSMEAEFVAKMNVSRQANGLRPYSVASDLIAVARSHSSTMASRQSLYHNPSLTSEVHSWLAVGENVGEGPSVGDLHTAFMNSPDHRANILDHDFTQVGVGVVVDNNGIIWVTADFRQPTGTTTSTSPSTSSHSSSPSPTQTTAAPTSYSSGGTVAAHPHPTLSPRAVLMQRVHELRKHHRRAHAADPVAQAFDYVATLSRLAG